LSAERIDDQPAWLTVEEAARVLRIGRTKAYALTREWRRSGGRSGLPVVDFGDVLRVPRRALDELAEATLPSRHVRAAELPRQRRPTSTRKRVHANDQLTLIDLTDPAS
jgi:excisionase family DNA binding protein